MDINLERQKGFSLTESLVAFTVTAVGLLAVASFQAGLMDQSAYNKARIEATALAQQKIEEFKLFTNKNEDAYIDDNGDGVMDADGTYTDDPIIGQNAEFARSWDIDSTDQSKVIDVTVSWADTDGELQSVMLIADIPWQSPRTAADQLAELPEPFVESPTGRAKMGDGNIDEIPVNERKKLPNISPDGLEIYQYHEDLLLVDPNGDILLTLIEACSSASGQCTDFVRISGIVYLDQANTQKALADIQVLASDAAHCERWVPSGSLVSPPTTPAGDYAFYNYTCYFGGGWHGNIGFVTAQGLQLTDKVCQGDPTAFEQWNQPVIAMRRAYRGMLHADVQGETRYFSHGIGDAVQLTGHDYVFTKLQAHQTEGYHCATVNAPMTRADSDSGRLFTDVPTDFFCLNEDPGGDGAPDFLDDYDTFKFTADTYCPFDPTAPPVASHLITGVVNVANTSLSDLENFQVTTSDGPGNCQLNDFVLSAGTYQASYGCIVYDWGYGWTGTVQVQTNSNYVFCPTSSANFNNLLSNASQNFDCFGVSTIVIEGDITYLTMDGSISSMTIVDNVSGNVGKCSFLASQYRCYIPYSGAYWNGSIMVESKRVACYSTENVFTFAGLVTESSPYRMRIVIAKAENLCPLPSADDVITPTVY